ncbi:MAG TPA: hypothetical protein VN028_08925 [Rhodocyclaceae bacterium]|nr:hypothetical protein [Rhodocyclaceae bacterium]
MKTSFPWLVAACLLCAAPAHADPAMAWRQLGVAQYLCGGVSDENMAALKSHRGEANAEALFTSGAQGAYLADVTVTIRNDKMGSFMFIADGPLCLLHLPPGRHTLEAEYRGHKQTRTLDIGKGLPSVKFNWPEV